MFMSEEIISLSQFKATATTMLKKIKGTGNHVILTQNGAAAAVVQDMETFENNQRALIMLKLMVQGEADISQGHLLEQKAVFRDMVKAEDKSYYEAEQAYPTASLEEMLTPRFSKFQDRAQMRRQNEYQEVLYDKYKATLAKKYGLGLNQIDEIMNEALIEDWAIPLEATKADLENFLSSEEEPQEDSTHLRLVGVAYGNSPDAMIEDVYGQRTHFVKVGDSINNIKIAEIGEDYVLLQSECEGKPVSKKLTDTLHFDACAQ